MITQYYTLHLVVISIRYVFVEQNPIMDAFRMFLDACCSKEPPCRLASDMEKSSVSLPHLTITGGIPYFQINPNIIFLATYIYICILLYIIILYMYTHTLGQLLRFPAGFFALPWRQVSRQRASFLESLSEGVLTLDDF